MQDFKIRCSAIGQIMANPKTKKDQEAGVLSKTAKTFLNTWYKENRFNRKKEFTNRFLEKGIAVEDEGIQLYSDVSGEEFIKKNEKSLSNDFCTGTPDVITADLVIDIKSSWDLFTFPMMEEDIENKSYWWQLQGYMWLTGTKKAELAYCLVDTPSDLIFKEINNIKWQSVGSLSEEEEAILEDLTEKNMTFDDIPKNLKVKRFYFEIDETAIDQIKERVKSCRSYLSVIDNQLR